MVNRAVRFDLHMPLRYREAGCAGWREGWTENISRSGVLFRAERLLGSNTPLELVLLLPGELTGSTPTTILCSGLIVRAVPPEAGNERLVLATSISSYRFLAGHHPNPDDPAWSKKLD